MLHLNFSHSKGLFDPRLARKLTVIGVGAIGGYVVSMAAKAGAHDITVIDPDVVDSHNVPMSIYRQQRDVGRLKVEALAEIVADESGVELKTVAHPYAAERLTGSVIVCVDSIQARQLVLRQVRHNGNVDLLIDTRVAMKYLSVHMIDPRSTLMLESYEKLFPETEAHRQTCGTHGFITVSHIAAAAAVEFLTEAWSGATMERHFRVTTSDLPSLEMSGSEEDDTTEAGEGR